MNKKWKKIHLALRDDCDLARLWLFALDFFIEWIIFHMKALKWHQYKGMLCKYFYANSNAIQIMWHVLVLLLNRASTCSISLSVDIGDLSTIINKFCAIWLNELDFVAVSLKFHISSDIWLKIFPIALNQLLNLILLAFSN